METRIRLAILGGGLPPPTLQHPVGPFRLDLAYPAIRLAIEYDGREHLTLERARRDLDRQAYITAAGWTKVLRFPAAEVHRPAIVAHRVRGELLRYGRRNNLTYLGCWPWLIRHSRDGPARVAWRTTSRTPGERPW